VGAVIRIAKRSMQAFNDKLVMPVGTLRCAVPTGESCKFVSYIQSNLKFNLCHFLSTPFAKARCALHGDLWRASREDEEERGDGKISQLCEMLIVAEARSRRRGESQWGS
jgi:hypothetical protein